MQVVNVLKRQNIKVIFLLAGKVQLFIDGNFNAWTLKAACKNVL